METNTGFWRRSESWEHEFLLQRLIKKTNYGIFGYICGGFTLFFLLGIISSVNNGEAKQIALYGILAFAMSLFTFAAFYLTKAIHKKLKNRDYFVQEVRITAKNMNSTQSFITVIADNGKTTTLIVNSRFAQELFVGARGMFVALPDVNTNVIGPNSYFFFREGEYAFYKENALRFSASSELSSSSELSDSAELSNAADPKADLSEKFSEDFTTPSLSEHELLLPALRKEARPWIFLCLLPLLLGNGLGMYYILFIKPKELLFLKTISVVLADISAILPYYWSRRLRSSSNLNRTALVSVLACLGELFVGITPLMKNKELSPHVTFILITFYIIVTILYVISLLILTETKRHLSRVANNRDYEILPGYVYELSNALIGSGRSSFRQYYLHIKCRDGKVYRLISTCAKNDKMTVGEKGTMIRVRKEKDPAKEPDYYFIP